MSFFTSPILEIDLSKLLKNYQILKSLAPQSIPAAVVKDDAYGLGAVEVSRVLYEKAGCRHFFVAHAQEGKKIRPVVPEAKIYVLQGIGKDSLDDMKEASLIPVINSPAQFAFWKQHKISGLKPIIHIETGLNRLGFLPEELENLSEEDRKSFSLVMSHLACADESGHFMNTRQHDEFVRLKKLYFPNIPASLSASDGVFLGQEFHFDMVRLGAAMYGINTAPYRPNRMANLITLKAPVLQVKKLKEGEYVGYSATYRAISDKKIAIASIGYGDGLPRSLSNVGKVWFCKQKNREEGQIIGRVSMDNLICDVSQMSEIKEGDYLHIIDDKYTLDDIAKDAQTIAYEVISRIGKNPRIIRKYK